MKDVIEHSSFKVINLFVRIFEGILFIAGITLASPFLFARLVCRTFKDMR